jgi:nucleotide-binding universal stress UspA family protein
VGGYRTIVVGTDGSETSYKAVERAAALAADAHATLVIACAYFPEKPDTHTQDILGDEAYQVMGSAPSRPVPARSRRNAGRASRATRCNRWSRTETPTCSSSATAG